MTKYDELSKQLYNKPDTYIRTLFFRMLGWEADCPHFLEGLEHQMYDIEREEKGMRPEPYDVMMDRKAERRGGA